MLNPVRVFYKNGEKRHAFALAPKPFARIMPCALTFFLAHFLYSLGQADLFGFFIAVPLSLAPLATRPDRMAIVLPRKNLNAASKRSSQAPSAAAPSRGPCLHSLEQVA